MIDRKVAPAFNKDFTWSLPNVQINKLRNEIETIWLNRIEQDVAKIDFIFRAGKWFEPKIGTSFFTFHLLEKGTKHKSSSEIAELIDRLGAQLEISTGADFVTISVYSLLKNIREAISLTLEFIQFPLLDEKELLLLKNIYTQNNRVNNSKNSFVASKLLKQNLFGAQHPYGSSVEEHQLSDLTCADLQEFHKAHFVPYEIYITGPLKSSDLNWIESQISLFPSAPKEFVSQSISPSLKKKVFVAKEESVQSSIRLGRRIIQKSHVDYPALVLLNHILGGYFGSRLMKNIREEKGLTYGIYSSLSSFMEDGLFTIGADVNKENIELTISEIHNELQMLIDKLIPEDELDIAKSHLLGSLQLDIASPISVVEKIKNIRLFNLREDYYSNLIKKIIQLKPANLQSIASNYLQQQELHLVVVG